MIDPNQCFPFDPKPTEGGFVAEFSCPDDLPYLQGHFPNHPVMPAVSIVDASWVLLSRICPGFELRVVRSAKFSGPIQPGMAIQIQATRTGPDEWSVSWRHGAHVLTELRLVGS